MKKLYLEKKFVSINEKAIILQKQTNQMAKLTKLIEPIKNISNNNKQTIANYESGNNSQYITVVTEAENANYKSAIKRKNKYISNQAKIKLYEALLAEYKKRHNIKNINNTSNDNF